MKSKSSLWSRIRKNSAFSLADQLLNILINTILIILIARYLAPYSLGQYALALSIVGVISIFSNFGIVTIMSRKIAQSPESTNYYLGNAIGIKFVISFPLLILFTLISVFIFNFNYETSLIIMLTVVYSNFISAILYVGSALISLHRNDIYFKINIFQKIMSFCGCLILLQNGYELKHIIYCLIITSIISFYISFLFIKNIVPNFRLRLDLRFCKPYILISLPLVLAGLGEFSNLKIDNLFIGLMLDEEAVGNYSSAFNLTLGVVLLFLSLIKVYFPNFIDCYAKSSKKAFQLFKNYNLFLLLFSVFAATLCYLVSDKLILIIYGPEYYQSIIVLKFLSISIVAMTLNRLTNYTLIAMGEYGYFTVITLIGTTLNLISNYFLILQFGLLGAAIATIVTETFILILGYKKIWSCMSSE